MLLGVNAIDTAYGITDNDWDVVQVKKAMIEASTQTAILSISEKLNTHQRIKICDLADVDILITELDKQDTILESFSKTGLTIF